MVIRRRASASRSTIRDVRPRTSACFYRVDLQGRGHNTMAHQESVWVAVFYVGRGESRTRGILASNVLREGDTGFR